MSAHSAGFLVPLDGEELIGAKQNRILNTAVLVDAHTEVTIPVTSAEIR